jgi:hypothetical protein
MLHVGKSYANKTNEEILQSAIHTAKHIYCKIDF